MPRLGKRLRAATLAVLTFTLMTGCSVAMATQSSDFQTPPAPTKEVPLRFAGHNFGAHCFDTLKCSVIYNNYDFTSLLNDAPAPPRPADFKDRWARGGYLDIKAFPGPAEVRWTAKDGSKHEASVDFDAIFKDRLIWHNVPKADMAHFYEGPYADNPDIFLEVNNRTINVYMSALIPTKTEQTPGNKNSDFRDDLFLAWTHTY
jgi:hypothetical protein